MRRVLVLAAYALLVGASGAVAAPITIDFEATGSPTGTVIPSVNSNGFSFVPVSGGVGLMANGANCNELCAANGTITFVMGGDGVGPTSVHPLDMSPIDPNAVFTLQGLDYAEFVGGQFSQLNATSIRVTGHIFGGGTFVQTLNIDGLNDGPGGANDFQVAVLAAGWAGLQLIGIEFAGFIGDDPNQSFQLDNIRVDQQQVVPEPATLLLVGVGATAMARRIRRRK